MATISLCMIVKNEEAVLARCLDSLKGIYDEAIIVDTGSTDRTKEIAKKYTDKVYDFEWIFDFSAARNFAMEKATCDYIYMADADEVIDEENRKKFLSLKDALDPGVEVVQMRYVNQLKNGSVYNFDREYRAKLYKRLRTFSFIDPVHEVVRESPVVFDSDVDIQHLQDESHAGRDIRIFEKAIEREGKLSDRLILLYARELYMAGTEEDFLRAESYFKGLSESGVLEEDVLKVTDIILAKIGLFKKDTGLLMKHSLKDIATDGTSEMCCILGEYFEKENDLKEAFVWYHNAAYETEPVLDLKSKIEVPIQAMERIK